jgi:hypothetical protein
MVRTTTTQRSWFLYTILGLFSLFAALAGIPKLFGLSFAITPILDLGYSQIFVQFIGLCWTCAAVGVWFNRYRSLAILCTIPIVSGAFASHITHGDGVYYALFLFVILGGIILYCDGFFRRLIPLTPKEKIDIIKKKR